jgi:hypothetical protein
MKPKSMPCTLCSQSPSLHDLYPLQIHHSKPPKQATHQAARTQLLSSVTVNLTPQFCPSLLHQQSTTTQPAALPNLPNHHHQTAPYLNLQTCNHHFSSQPNPNSHAHDHRSALRRAQPSPAPLLSPASFHRTAPRVPSSADEPMIDPHRRRCFASRRRFP